MTNKIGAIEALKTLTKWSAGEIGRDAIHRQYAFADFKTAWAFMSACALKAEQMNHHPEWFNVYGKVDVTLTTHDLDGVSTKDVELGAYMDALFETLS